MAEYNFVMTLNPPVIELIKDTLMVFLEIEILQGKVELLPDGQTRYSMNLHGEKEQIIKERMLAFMHKDIPMNNN